MRQDEMNEEQRAKAQAKNRRQYIKKMADPERKAAHYARVQAYSNTLRGKEVHDAAYTRYKNSSRGKAALLKNNQRWRKSAKGQASVLWFAARDRAKRKNLPFSLSKARVRRAVEAGACEVTGIPFVFQSKGRGPFTPSLDQTESGQGYTDENVKVVVWIYNAAKGDWKHGDVMIMAKALVQKAESEEVLS